MEEKANAHEEDTLVQLERLEEVLKALKEAEEQETLPDRFSSYARAVRSLADLDPTVLPDVQREVVRRHLYAVGQEIERELLEMEFGSSGGWTLCSARWRD